MTSNKRALVVSAALLVLLSQSALSQAARRQWKPKATAVLEVRQPDGALRLYHTPSGAVYWSNDLPVVQGDRITAYAFVSTGEAALKKALIRLDNKELKTITTPPWHVEINTKDLAVGNHFVEVVATADGRIDIGTAVFLVAPATEPLLKETITPPTTPQPQPVTPVTPELVCRVRSRADAVDQALARGEAPVVKEPTLFWVQAAEGVKEFQYTLLRVGKETYRSPAIPILSHMRLGPKQADGTGLEPGEVTLEVRAGDGKGNFGPPAAVKIQVASGSG
jgi:hypothetical protein